MTEDEKFMRRLRKVRTQMYEETKNMTPAERVAYRRAESMKTIKEYGLEKYIVTPEQLQGERATSL